MFLDSRDLLFLTTFSFPLVAVWFSFLLYLFRVLSSAFLSSEGSSFALSFSFLSEHLLLLFVNAKAALALVEMNNAGFKGRFN